MEDLHLTGIYASSTIAFLIGVAFTTLINNTNPAYDFPDVYTDRGIGGLVGAVFKGCVSGVRGLVSFIEVILGFSVVAANIPNIYSFGLCI